MGPFSKTPSLLLCMLTSLNLEGAFLASSTADKGYNSLHMSFKPGYVLAKKVRNTAS